MSSDETMQHPIWNNYIFNLKEIHCSSKTLVLRVKSLFSENGNFNELMNLQIKKVSQIGSENVNVNENKSLSSLIKSLCRKTVFQI